MKQQEFDQLTRSLFSTPEGKLWLRELKNHPRVRYYESASRLGTMGDNGIAYFDGVKEVPRMIDLALSE